MTPEQALKEMIALQTSDDPEAAHGEGDGILCALLRSLGHGDLVDAWDAIEPKWYA